MARKVPRKKSRIALPAVATNPVALALAAVAGVFALGLGVSWLMGQPEPKPVSMAKPPAVAAPVAPLPPPVPARPPVSAAVSPPVVPPPAAPVITEPDAGSVAEASDPPGKGTVALLPPPVPPSVPLPAVQPPSGNAAPWRRFAVPVKAVAPGRPVIAVVIDDMGLDRKRSTKMAGLPGPLTLSWLPYARELAGQTQAARANGHELMLHMPMEPSVDADPGPDALLVRLDKTEILRRARAALDSFDGYVGVNNHMGSRFTADRSALSPVLAELHRRGLLWLDSKTTPHSAGLGIAQDLNMPFAGRDVFLDNIPAVGAIRAQLGKVETVAKQQGYAIAIGHPHDATFEALASWLPDVQKRGFSLVPVSAVVRAHHAGG
ncbi:divergent polysaccharide deacetylase family protein [Azospirillum griseum]|uniref:Divergent polysaccharide deacetylase family protein n=2 Tax=Azospirillum griseum TaxID=2496639 RepID=A0A3S0I3X9_9PROT|nr:divergent polysaccharide deacetylase family protein [Azospirillum griseum]